MMRKRSPLFSFFCVLAILAGCSQPIATQAPSGLDGRSAAAGSLTLTGPNGSLTVSGMTGTSLTVTYTTPTLGSANLYVSQGNGTGLVLASQPMAYANGAYSYTFSNPSFTAGAVVYIDVLATSTAGVQTNVPQGSLANTTSWATFTYGSASAAPTPTPTPSGNQTLTGPNGSLTVSGMTGTSLTVTYTTPTLGSANLYVSQGNGTGLILASQPMAYANGAYSYTFSNASFTAGAVVYLDVLATSTAGVQTNVPQGTLANTTSWASFTYGSGAVATPTPAPWANWTAYDGTWSVVNGAYQVVNGANIAKSVNNSTYSTAITLDADVQVVTSGQASLIWDVANPTVGTDAFQGYGAGIDTGGTVWAGKWTTGWNSLGSTPATITAGTWYHLQIIVTTGNFQVLVNGVQKLSVNDTSFAPGGHVGVRGGFSNTDQFKNVVVGTALPTPTPTPTPVSATAQPWRIAKSGLTQTNPDTSNGWETTALASTPVTVISAPLSAALTLAGGAWEVILQLGDTTGSSGVKIAVYNGSTLLASTTGVTPGNGGQPQINFTFPPVSQVTLAAGTTLSVQVQQTSGPSALALGWDNGFFHSYLTTNSVGAGVGESSVPYKGFLPVQFTNFTGGVYPDSQVYISVLGQVGAAANYGAGFYLDAAASAYNPNQAQPYQLFTGHGGQNIATFSLAALKATSPNGILNIPALFGGRVCISLGAPVSMPISSDGSGYAGVTNTGVNKDIYFDFWELSVSTSGVLFANVTQVDEFTFPIALQSQIATGVYGTTVGAFLDRPGSGFPAQFTATTPLTAHNGVRARIFSDFQNSVTGPHPEFAGSIVNTSGGLPLRVVSPVNINPNLTAPQSGITPFGDVTNLGGNPGNYFDAYVSQAWSYYSYTGSNRMTLDNGMMGFTCDRAGTLSDGTVINANGSVTLPGGAILTLGGTSTPILWPFVAVDSSNNKYYLGKPSTVNVLMGAGSLTSVSSVNPTGSGASTELHIGDELCSDITRHVLSTASQSFNDLDAAQYYTNAPANFYAQFWHYHSPGGLAYGYSYDDFNNQSSTISVGSPQQLNVGIYW